MDAVIESSHDASSHTFEVAHVFLGDAPEWIRGLPVELVPGQGTPTTVYTLLLQMKQLGIRFGTLKHARVVAIEDAASAIEIERAIRSGTPRLQAVLACPLLDVVVTVLAQSGHEIVAGSERLDDGPRRREPVGALLRRQIAAGLVRPEDEREIPATCGVDGSYEVTTGFTLEVDLVRAA